MAPTPTGCSTGPGSCCVTATGSGTPRSRWSPTPTRAATNSRGEGRNDGAVLTLAWPPSPEEVAMSGSDASSIVTTYVKAWTSGDFDTARSTLRDDVTFIGPLGTADGVDECMRGLQGLKQIVETSEQRKVIARATDCAPPPTSGPPRRAPFPLPAGSRSAMARSPRFGCSSTPVPWTRPGSRGPG